jgi:DNA mismatch repair protein MutS2
MRTDEALQVVQDFIDTALMIQFRNLRILHGKGNGILRQMISSTWSRPERLRGLRMSMLTAAGQGSPLWSWISECSMLMPDPGMSV